MKKSTITEKKEVLELTGARGGILKFEFRDNSEDGTDLFVIFKEAILSDRFSFRLNYKMVRDLTEFLDSVYARQNEVLSSKHDERFIKELYS